MHIIIVKSKRGYRIIKQKRGYWYLENPRQKKSYTRVCSVCGKEAYFVGEGNYPNCPYCLSEMDAETKTKGESEC